MHWNSEFNKSTSPTLEISVPSQDKHITSMANGELLTVPQV